jgi:hypothetical protein
MNFVETVLEYFRHSSSWKGLFSVLTAVGVTVVPEFQELVITAGLGIIGIIQFFVDDNDVTKKISK